MATVQNSALTIAGWDATPDDAKEILALQIRDALGSEVHLDGIETYVLGNQEHTLARYFIRDNVFVLLPGYEGELGHEPSAAEFQQVSLEEGANAEPHDTSSMMERVRRVLTPPRRVTLAPFLLESIPVALEDKEQLASGQWVGSGNPVLRAEVARQVTNSGFRFPTSDEWEYACAGGSRMLFRWGDYWPPIHWTPEAKRQSDDWQDDLRPNAFGLLIGRDPYDLEYCAESDVLRGGDGGTAASSGAGLIEEWLPLASAYRFPFTERFVSILRRPFLRRALTVPDHIYKE